MHILTTYPSIQTCAHRAGGAACISCTQILQCIRSHHKLTRGSYVALVFLSIPFSLLKNVYVAHGINTNL